MNPEQLLDDLERWAREAQRCSAGDSAAARRARGKLKFARQQVLDHLRQRSVKHSTLVEMFRYTGWLTNSQAIEVADLVVVLWEGGTLEEAIAKHDGAYPTTRKPKTMNFCRTCRHWLPPEPGYAQVPNLGVCKAIPFNQVVEGPAGPDGPWELHPDLGDVQAVVTDTTGDHDAELHTFPDFGCTMHEPQPESTKP